MAWTVPCPKEIWSLNFYDVICQSRVVSIYFVIMREEDKDDTKSPKNGLSDSSKFWHLFRLVYQENEGMLIYWDAQLQTEDQHIYNLNEKVNSWRWWKNR